jgi:hypothetical protein
MAPASVNRELAALRRMFSLAVKADKLGHRPHVAMLTEDNARQGFLRPGARGRGAFAPSASS